MNNMLRYIVYILLFLLFTITVGQDYHTVETTDLPPQTSCYQQQQDPCKRTVDFLFTNNFADMPQIAISLDNPSTSKFKCIVRILAALNELKKQELQTNHIVCHTFHSLYTEEHFALAPNNLTDASQICLDFLKQVPVTWDETVFIDGYPGKYCILARRHGDKWYVAGVNAQKEPLKLKIQLPMFAKGNRVTLYNDDLKRNVYTREVTLSKNKELSLTILSGGGIVIVK